MENNNARRILHGNHAKTDPNRNVESLNQSCRVTMSEKKEGETPIVSDEDVAYAKAFVEENKK